jgi:hypothetical protein
MPDSLRNTTKSVQSGRTVKSVHNHLVSMVPIKHNLSKKSIVYKMTTAESIRPNTGLVCGAQIVSSGHIVELFWQIGFLQSSGKYLNKLP